MESRNKMLLVIWTLVSVVCVYGQRQELKYTIEEELSANTFVADIPLDARLQSEFASTVFATLSYNFLSQESQASLLFKIDSNSGIIKTTLPIDRDDLCLNVAECLVELDVAVHDPFMTHFEIIKVVIEIVDINDNDPEFPQSEINVKLSESVPINHTFLTQEAFDIDEGNNSVQNYELISPTGTFGLDIITGSDGSKELAIVVRKELDREKTDFYQVEIVAKDGGSPPRSGAVRINISIADINDHTPRFGQANYKVSIPENTEPNTSIIQVTATDDDIGSNGDIRYSISNLATRTIKSLFGINATSGELYVKSTLDYEVGSVHHIPVDATDQSHDPRVAHTTIVLTVLDLNDNRPEIKLKVLSGEAQVSEGSEPGAFVALVSVKDKDDPEGINGQVKCNLSSDNFALNAFTEKEFKVVSTTKFDRERQDTYNVTITCSDMGVPQQFSENNFIVNILDENDHTPQFETPSISANIVENNRMGAYIIQVTAHDDDILDNGKIEYKLHSDAGELFRINADNGKIYANVKFNRETTDRIQFRVIASDKGVPPRSAITYVTLRILDLNDEPPIFFQNTYPFNVTEGEDVDTFVGSVSAFDADFGDNAKFRYALDQSTDAKHFKINAETGRITTSKVIDRERKSMFHFLIMAYDQGSPQQSGSASVIVSILDINDNPPIITFPSAYNNTVYINPSTPVGNLITTVEAEDRDFGNNAKMTFLFLDGDREGLFRIDTQTGDIYLQEDLSTSDETSHKLKIMVADHGPDQKKSRSHLSVIISDSTTFIGYGSPATGTKKQAMGLSQQNIIIVICLAAATIILSVILIIAIFRMRRRSKPKGRRYNVRLQNDKADDKKKLAGGVGKGSPNGSPTNGKPVIDSRGPADGKNTSFSLETETPNSTMTGMNGTSLSHDKKMIPQSPNTSFLSNTSMESKPSMEQKCMNDLTQGNKPSVMNGQNGRPWNAADRDLEVHRLIDILKRDQNKHKGHHGETSSVDSDRSNPDSGKGTSENDEDPLNKSGDPEDSFDSKDLKSPKKVSFDSNPFYIKEKQGKNPKATTLGNNNHSNLEPDLDNSGYHSNQSDNGDFPRNIKTSTSSDSLDDNTLVPSTPQGAPTLHTFKPQDSKPNYIPQTFSGNNLRGPVPPPKPKRSHSDNSMQPPAALPPRGNSGRYTPVGNRSNIPRVNYNDSMSPRSYQPLPQQSPSAANRQPHFQNNPSAFQGQQSQSQSDSKNRLPVLNQHNYPNYAKTGGPFKDFTIADLDRALGDSGTDMDRQEDDRTTTTSGSYTVDPQELTNEIDNLFFKEMIV
ncbi:unnamed protein product [Owenia fusiformis]|uniref:Uncharacterized protein n=1 Tax=Owenia fusiformis TaxID=6347 RepID=A0A8J1TGT2_OWEFU|nr:unnamed protein product [Owenia fusiformis]